MLHFLRDHDNSIPMLVMLMFVGISILVTLYVLTDRRRQHLKRMESMPLDDGIPTAHQPSESNHG